MRSGRGATAAALMLSLTLVAAGCGSDAARSEDGPGSKDVATGGKEFATADEKTAALGSDADPGVFPRTVEHANGTTTLEEKPRRVVVLDTGELDAVLSLGITPVGMVTTEGAQPVPSYLADRVDGVETVGTIAELDLEKIAALEPGLILGSQLRADKLYDELSAIAPTVFSIRPGFPWKENFALAGEALGMEEQTTQQLNDYGRAAQALDEEIEGDPTISLVRWMPERIRLYGNQSLIGVILEDAGLSRPELQDVEDLAVEVSAENIDKADGDYIFYTSYGDPAATGEAETLVGSRWKGLDAVENGRAFRVDDDVWFLGLGPTGAGLILDDLDAHLTD